MHDAIRAMVAEHAGSETVRADLADALKDWTENMAGTEGVNTNGGEVTGTPEEGDAELSSLMLTLIRSAIVAIDWHRLAVVLLDEHREWDDGKRNRWNLQEQDDMLSTGTLPALTSPAQSLTLTHELRDLLRTAARILHEHADEMTAEPDPEDDAEAVADAAIHVHGIASKLDALTNEETMPDGNDDPC